MAALLIAATLAGWAFLDALARRQARPAARTEADHGTARFVQATGVGGLFLGLLLAGWLPALTLGGPRWAWVAAGITVAWAGIALRIVSVRVLGSMWSELVGICEDHEVVQRGPYRIIRHPSYTGVLVLSAGIGLATANLGSLVVVVGSRLVGYVRRIGVEEAALTESLGEAYTRYAEGRARLVPGIW